MTKIVLIGAGSAIFGLGTISDIFNSSILRGATITLHDIDFKALKKTQLLAEKFKDEFSRDFKIEVTSDRKEALKDANFVIISIEIGQRFDLWEQDWKIPLQYGFKQIYGENGGPGGLFHALRIIPPILDICDDIQEISPNAFVFNYSNPMQRICHAVTSKYPSLNFVGLCHEINSMNEQLPVLMKTDFSNIEFRAGGLNHLSILLEVRYKDTGIDGYPIIHNRCEDFYTSIVNEYDDYHRSKPGAERGVFFELYRTYGYLPITVDSHLGEYIQWAHSVADHHGINEFYNSYKKKCLNFHEGISVYSKFFDPKRKMRERIIPIIEAIIEDSGVEEAAVNIPNENLIFDLPKDIVVEVPAKINKSGFNGVCLKNFPSAFGRLLNNQVGVIKLTTDAILNKSKHSAYQALLADPVVDNPAAASNLLDTMLETQKEYLDYLR